MNMDSGFVPTADGVRLYFEAVGAGRRTVIVPGMHLRDDLAGLVRERRLVFFDPRNRGRSDAVASPAGILQDADDVLAVARHFTKEPVDLIGHSFAGLMVVLCARAWPDDVRRVVQIGPIGMDPDRRYPDGLVNHDATFVQVMRDLTELLPQRRAFGDVEFCGRVWSVLRPLYVTDPRDAFRIRWDRCELVAERSAMRYFNEVTLPSIRRLALAAADFEGVRLPVLVVHGDRDRSAPYGGGREWALELQQARLLTVPGAGHAPWVEAPDLVLDAIDTFLRGEWPEKAEKVTQLIADGELPVAEEGPDSQP
jgi:pimeloyl-ACP methyl ester carboxylesterase